MDTHSSQQAAESQVSRRSLLQTTAFVGVAALLPATLRGQHPVGDIYGEGLPACRRGAYPAVKPGYTIDNPLAEIFRELSEALTGVHGLDAHLNKAYLTRIATNPELTSGLPPLLDAFRQIRTKPKEIWENQIDTAIMNNPQLRRCAEQVIYVWYFSALFLPDPADNNPDPTKRNRIWVYGDYGHYPRGLVWSLIGAHAPGVPGGPYGYWADTVTL